VHWASGRPSGGHLVEQVGLADAPTLPDLARSTWLMLAGQFDAWKREAIEKLAKVFDEKGNAREQNRDAELTKLHAKIGQLVVERDFLAKAFDC
jgi:transposase